MSVGALFVSAFIIGFSGAMMPGPLLTYVINGSLRKGFKAGPLLIVGHAILELILIVLLLLGLNNLFSNQIFTSALGLIGGSILLWMGYGMIKSVIKREISLEGQVENKVNIAGLVLPGAIVSISNPYWVLWWATVGMTYLAKSHQQGVLGTGAFFTGHILADFVWYSFISWLVVFGRKLLNDRMYRGLVALFGIILIYFALMFMYDGVKFFIFS
ncbi:LysE family transporter [Halothermothrix orenii]|uniref:Lysine exporter protein (LYSE/YGGA) n=1 Tax=Halothermothrix orenii (strain H 168 / OCM 544 / DSM 9562) TaxID=373903 RepID=B8CXR2_HALOH|nr:LysE family transporter [Halothermothrix orenii]ACL70081.1 Lysine exporter protein (LYSE/YGGA) [Halothermothrix orenii H 168]